MQLKVLISLATISLLTACTSRYQADIDYNPEYNFSAVSSYAIIAPARNDVTEQSASLQHVSSLDEDRIVKALHVALQRKGMQAVSEDSAHTLVRFQIATQDKQKLRTYNTGVYNCWRCRGIYTYPYIMQQVEIREYTEGTLIIDMIDPQTNKSVWRSVLSQPLKKNIPVQEKQAYMQQLVDNMLFNYKALAQ